MLLRDRPTRGRPRRHQAGPQLVCVFGGTSFDTSPLSHTGQACQLACAPRCAEPGASGSHNRAGNRGASRRSAKWQRYHRGAPQPSACMLLVCKGHDFRLLFAQGGRGGGVIMRSAKPREHAQRTRRTEINIKTVCCINVCLCACVWVSLAKA